MKTIFAPLVVVLLLLTSAIQDCSTATAQSPPIENMISSDSVATIIMHPKKMMALKSMELFPHEILKALGEEQLGADFTQASEAILLIQAPTSPPLEFGVMVRFDQPQAFTGAYEDAFKKIEKDGKTYFQIGPRGEQVVMVFPDDKTMLLGTMNYIAGMAKTKVQDGPLKDLVKKYPADGVLQAYVAVEPVRELLNSSLPPKDQVPPPFQRWIDAPELMDYAYMNVDLSENFRVETRIGAVDEKAADRLRRIQAQSVQFAKAGAMTELANNIQEMSEPMQLAINTYADRAFQFIETASKPEVKGNELVYTLKPDSGTVQVATIGILTGMLLPAVQQVRFAARRTQSSNNLRQMSLACMNYESAFMRFPQQAIYSEDGKPLLSWRVAILPFIEQKALYDRFHLDEPWDSPHNIKLLEVIPAVYRSPTIGDLGNKTPYQAFVGKETVFPDDAKRKIGFGAITDGTSNTIMFVESNEANAIEWTKPGDIPFDPKQPVGATVNALPGGFNAVFCDGSTHFITDTVPQMTLKHLIMRADGNPVGIP